MEQFKEFAAKTVEEAIEEGLKELGIAREDAEIEVLEEGKKKLFGYTKARVRITFKNASEEAKMEETDKESKEEKKAQKPAKENKKKAEKSNVDEQGRTDGERAVEFLEGLFEIMGLTATTELVREDEKVVINVTAANTNAVIGKRGAVLDAVQTLAGAVANTGRDDYKRVVVDCENYRENREATLKRLAENLAEKAIRYEKKIRLEPMNPYERRIIHAALSDREDVKTQSEGKEPNRYIVIVPAYVRYPDRPASFARDERRGNRGNDRGGYGRKPYGNRGGYGGRKPYNRDRGYDKGEGGTNLESRGYDKGRSGGSSYKKTSSDFFGTFLGNSKDENKDE
ncbi:MAG: protein jag [Clostridia bacterium]|nr:protein jag [Clostridia bacterium]